MKKILLLTMVMTMVLSLFSIDSSKDMVSANEVESNNLQDELIGLFQDEIVDKSTEELLRAEEEFAEMVRLLTIMPDEYAGIDISLPKLDWLIANTELEYMKVKFETDRFNYNKYLRGTTKGEVSLFSFTSCLKGIGEAIVYNAIPAAKLLKIKKIVSASGGSLKFANKVLGKYIKYTGEKKKNSRVRKYTNKQAFKKSLEDVNKQFPHLNAMDGLLELLSVKSIKDGCF